MKVKNVYVVPVYIHIVAESAAEAEEILTRADSLVFDSGPVTMTAEYGGHQLDLLYINGAPDEVTENEVAYRVGVTEAGEYVYDGIDE